MRIGIAVGGVDAEVIDFVREAERLGAESVWVPEAWGHDALTPLGALAATTGRIALASGVVQLGTRTPAMLAMSALSLQHLSGGRFRLGVGVSGPQVMEGWHGVRFDRPVQRTRETIEILRLVTAGERLVYDGEIHRLPLPGGEGRALRVAAPPAPVPVYVAALGPRNLRLTGELADGWLGNSFLCPTAHVFLDEIRAGAEAAGRDPAEIDITVGVSCEITDEVEAAGRRHAAGFAFTFGAMGSSRSNFYNAALTRQGYGDVVAEVERLWRAGDRDAARRAVPVELGLGMNLIGPPAEIRRRLVEYRDAGVDMLRVTPVGETLDDRLAVLGHLLDIARTV
ncbi:MAG: LLM class flavin-dependent oxidoreductase [Actinomyces sp.]|nr:MAG: LLM class flavin-dependent oxidoreductase [Actinomyces sp.]